MKGGCIDINENLSRGQALPGVYETIVSLLNELTTIKKILDVPSGFGILSEKLKKNGYDVIAIDIEENKYNPRDNKLIITDLNDGMPIMDNSIDAIISVEGIEHLNNPLRTLKELFRVLKDNGYLILTTPNVVNLRSRFKFFLTGELFWFDEMAINRFGHISPQFPFILEYFVFKTGFKISKTVGNNKIRILNLLIWIILLPLSRIKRYRMNSLKYVNSQTLIYLCQKT